jgi:hypothetical protein
MNNAALFFKEAGHRTAGLHLCDFRVIPEPVHQVEQIRKDELTPAPYDYMTSPSMRNDTMRFLARTTGF